MTGNESRPGRRLALWPLSRGMSKSRLFRLTQLVEQSAGGDEIRRIETFCESGEDRRQRFTRRREFPLPTPDFGQIRGSSKFPQTRALLSRSCEARLQQPHRFDYV